MYPLVIAAAPLPAVLAAVGRLTSPFRELGPGQERLSRVRDGSPVLVGEVRGWSYLLEYDHTPLATCWGLLARVARGLDTLVAGLSYDPGEGHCEFFASQGDRVVRGYWDNPRRAVRPYSLGTPLPSEAVTPLSAADGAGLVAAVRDLGFEQLAPDGGFDRADGDRWVAWPGDGSALLAGDEFRAAVNDHVRSCANPDYRPMVPVVRVRCVEPGVPGTP